MAFSLDEFRANINSVGGLAKPSKFAVFITPPPFTSGMEASKGANVVSPDAISLNDKVNLADARVLSMLCDSVNLPGKSLLVNEYKPQGYGKTVKMPYDVQHDTLTPTFFLDNDHRVMNFMQYWFQEIINTSSEFEGANSTFKNRTSYELNYKKSYSTTMLIQFYANGDESSFIEYEFHDVYPMQLGNIQLAWDANDQIAKLPVEFTYSGYTTFRGTLGGLGTYGTRGVDYFINGGLVGGSLLSTLTDPTHKVRNLIDTFTNISNIF